MIDLIYLHSQQKLWWAHIKEKIPVFGQHFKWIDLWSDTRNVHEKNSIECEHWTYISTNRKTVEWRNNGFLCWWISPFSPSHYEKMMSKPPTDAIDGERILAREHHLKSYIYSEIYLSWQSFIYASKSHWKYYKWSWNRKTTTRIYIFIHFFHFYYYSMIWMCSCGVVRNQMLIHGMQRIFDFEWRSVCFVVIHYNSGWWYWLLFAGWKTETA